MQLTRETLGMITHMVPTLGAFRNMQLAHGACRLTGAQQMMVRRRFRQFTPFWIDEDWYERHPQASYALPNGKHDGVYCYYGWGYQERSYFINGGKQGVIMECGRMVKVYTNVSDGECVQTNAAGAIVARCVYTQGCRHGPRLKYNDNGRLIKYTTYVDGRRQGVAMKWSSEGARVKHIVVESLKQPLWPQFADMRLW